MRIEQTRLTTREGWRSKPPGELGRAASLALVFGSRRMLCEGAALAEIRAACPGVPLFGCSTAGEIFGTNVGDDSLVLTAVQFDKTSVRVAGAAVDGPANSFGVGQRIAAQLPSPILSEV